MKVAIVWARDDWQDGWRYLVAQSITDWIDVTDAEYHALCMWLGRQEKIIENGDKVSPHIIRQEESVPKKIQECLIRAKEYEKEKTEAEQKAEKRAKLRAAKKAEKQKEKERMQYEKLKNKFEDKDKSVN